MLGVGRRRGGCDLVEGLDGRLETFRGLLELERGALAVAHRVEGEGELDLHEGDVEFEVQLVWGDGEGLGWC